MPHSEHIRKVLFICTANVCRSPMAEAVFNALVSDAGMPAQAESAGISARPGEHISTNALAALDEIGVDAGDHRARQVSGSMLDEADLVLVMSMKHAENLRYLFRDNSHKIFILPQYVNDPAGSREISDPNRYTMTAYRASLCQIFGCVSLLVTQLRTTHRSGSSTAYRSVS